MKLFPWTNKHIRIVKMKNVSLRETPSRRRWHYSVKVFEVNYKNLSLIIWFLISNGRLRTQHFPEEDTLTGIYSFLRHIFRFGALETVGGGAVKVKPKIEHTFDFLVHFWRENYQNKGRRLRMTPLEVDMRSDPSHKTGAEGTKRETRAELRESEHTRALIRGKYSESESEQSKWGRRTEDTVWKQLKANLQSCKRR